MLRENKYSGKTLAFWRVENVMARLLLHMTHERRNNKRRQDDEGIRKREPVERLGL